MCMAVAGEFGLAGGDRVSATAVASVREREGDERVFPSVTFDLT